MSFRLVILFLVILVSNSNVCVRLPVLGCNFLHFWLLFVLGKLLDSNTCAVRH